MKAAPGHALGVASGLLGTFANVGMVFSSDAAILVASSSIGMRQEFAIFVGTSTLSRRTADAFTVGVHAAFYSSTALMAVAAVLPAARARPGRATPGSVADAWSGSDGGPRCG